MAGIDQTESLENSGERKKVNYVYCSTKNLNVDDTTNHSTSNGIKAEEDPSVLISNLYKYFVRIINLYWNKLSQHPQQRQIKLSGLSFIFLLFVYLLVPIQPPSSFVKRFVDSTNGIFNEINSVDLPASDAIMKHTVSCRRVANMIERSPAFEDHGNQIALNLRLFGEKVMIAGQNLRKMYRKGSFVFTAFDIEIDSMMKKLEHLEFDDIKYFSGRFNKLANIIKEFRDMVTEASKSVTDAEIIRDSTEKYIIEGNRQAENFINNNDKISNVELIIKTKEELRFTKDIMKHLHNTAIHLDKINKILIDYEDKLFDLSTELNQNSENYDNILKISKLDIKYLKNSVDILKRSHDKFIRKENLID